MIQSYMGKHQTSGGRDFKNFEGGGIFFVKIFLGKDFFFLKGGISLTNLHQNSRIFLKFSSGGYI